MKQHLVFSLDGGIILLVMQICVYANNPQFEKGLGLMAFSLASSASQVGYMVWQAANTKM